MNAFAVLLAQYDSQEENYHLRCQLRRNEAAEMDSVHVVLGVRLDARARKVQSNSLKVPHDDLAAYALRNYPNDEMRKQKAHSDDCDILFVVLRQHYRRVEIQGYEMDVVVAVRVLNADVHANMSVVILETQAYVQSRSTAHELIPVVSMQIR